MTQSLSQSGGDGKGWGEEWDVKENTGKWEWEPLWVYLPSMCLWYHRNKIKHLEGNLDFLKGSQVKIQHELCIPYMSLECDHIHASLIYQIISLLLENREVIIASHS